MARLKRVSIVGVAEHVIQRGNNRQVCFASEEDSNAYLTWLKKYAKEYEVEVHAWVLMTNHIHLLCTPLQEHAVSRMMQALGRMYVRYFNHTYKRTGTLWEGRFKSSLVQSDEHLLEVYRYIELNPVRAGMVEGPSEYLWSSYHCNSLGKVNDLLTPHSIYLALGGGGSERCYNYTLLFKQSMSSDLLDEIRKHVNSGLALGNQHFTDEVERLTKQRVTEGVRGRPRVDV